MEKLHSVTAVKPRELVKTQTNTKMILGLFGLGLVGLSFFPSVSEEKKELTDYEKLFKIKVDNYDNVRNVTWFRCISNSHASSFNISLNEDGFIEIQNIKMGTLRFPPKEIDSPEFLDILIKKLNQSKPACTQNSLCEYNSDFTNEVAKELVRQCKEYVHKTIIRPKITLGKSKELICLIWDFENPHSAFHIEKFNNKWCLLRQSIADESPKIHINTVTHYIHMYTQLPKKYSGIQAIQIVDLINALNSTELRDQEHLDKIVNILTGNDSDANLETATTDPY